MKKGIVLPFLLLLASVALILGAFFLLDNESKTKNQNPTQIASPLPNVDTSNWKTYRDDDIGYSISYPQNWFSSDGSLVVSEPSSYFSIKRLSYNLKDPLINEYGLGNSNSDIGDGIYIEIAAEDGVDRQISLENWVNDEIDAQIPLIELNLSGNRALKLEREKNNRHVVSVYSKEGAKTVKINAITNSLEIFQKYETIFNQILSTFKFTDINENLNSDKETSAGSIKKATTLKKIKSDDRFDYYDGSIAVSGKYQEYSVENVFGLILCFYADDATGYLIPRDPNLWGEGNGDSRTPWFCFEDQKAAKEMLGINDQAVFNDKTVKCIQGNATIKVSNYIVDKLEGEVWDTANLDKIISKEKYKPCE